MNMIVEIFTTKDRLPFIQEKLGDKVVILEDLDHDYKSAQIKIQITLTSSIDVLYLFHAGVDFGIDKGLSLYK